MTRGSKRIWSPNISLEDGVSIALNFLIRSREKKILIENTPKVYKVFKKEGLVPVRDFKEISSFLRFSKNDTPDSDRSKNSLVKLLSVSLKAHQHWFPNGKIKNEPYVFTIPDLLNSDMVEYGLIYYIESEGKCFSLIVADWNMEQTICKNEKFYSNDVIPVVLSKNSFKWLNLKHWRELKKEITDDNNLLHISSLEHKKELFSRISLIKDKKDFNYGKLVSYPIEFKNDVSFSGGEWANGIKSWFVPYGFDYDLIIEYLDYVVKEKK